MTLYSIGVFLHVVAMLGLFIALGAEWLILSNLSQASDTTEARAWIRASAVLPPVALSSLALILLTGIYLVARTRASTMAWIQVSLGALVLIGILSGMAGTRMRAIRKTAANDSRASLDTYRRSVTDAGLLIPIRIRFATALAIVLLMITRPNMNTALPIIGVAVAAGLLWGAPMLRRRVQGAAF